MISNTEDKLNLLHMNLLLIFTIIQGKDRLPAVLRNAQVEQIVRLYQADGTTFKSLL
jgi:hypothetical protein